MLEMLEWDSKWNGTKSGMGLKSFPVQEYETSRVEWSEIGSSVKRLFLDQQCKKATTGSYTQEKLKLGKK